MAGPAKADESITAAVPRSPNFVICFLRWCDFGLTPGANGRSNSSDLAIQTAVIFREPLAAGDDSGLRRLQADVKFRFHYSGK
jgi:hypothetical protein